MTKGKLNIALFVISFFVCSSGLFGQIIKRDGLERKVISGFYTNIFYFDATVNQATNEKAKMLSLEIRPYIAYNIYKNLHIGIQGGYEFWSSNFYNKQNFIEVGGMIRYVAPFYVNKSFFRKFRLYVEFGYYKTNYRIVSETVNTIEYKDIKIEEDYIFSSQLNQQKVSFPIGIMVQLKEFFFIDLNWQHTMYKNGTNKDGFMIGAGFSFGKKK